MQTSSLLKGFPIPSHGNSQLWVQERKLRLRRYCFYLMGYKDVEIPESEAAQAALFQQVKHSWREQREGQMSLREVAELLDISTTSLRHYCAIDSGRDVWELQFESLVGIAPRTLPDMVLYHLPEYMRGWDVYALHYWLSFGATPPMNSLIDISQPAVTDWPTLLQSLPEDPDILDLAEQVIRRKRLWGEEGVCWALVQEAIENAPWSIAELDAMANALAASGKVDWGDHFFSRLHYREVRPQEVQTYCEQIARLLMTRVEFVQDWLKPGLLIASP